jgi:hypothetical protein
LSSLTFQIKIDVVIAEVITHNIVFETSLTFNITTIHAVEFQTIIIPSAEDNAAEHDCKKKAEEGEEVIKVPHF